MSVEHIPKLVQQLYAVVAELERLFPGRPFTPDGHLVGSLGEVLAADRYDLVLLPCSAKVHDATAVDGRGVQIKATQGSSVALRAKPDHLIVLRLTSKGGAEEIYNGPGAPVWARAGKMQRNGQRPISLSLLGKLMEQLPPGASLPTTGIQPALAGDEERAIHSEQRQDRGGALRP